MQWYDTKLNSLPVQVESRVVNSYAGQTHILVTGSVDNPPLIVLHGMNMNAVTMDSAIVALSKSHRVYAIDIIGMPGKSAGTRPNRQGPGYPKWLAEVMEQLELSQASFLGLSFGGWIILKLASLWPQRIGQAVLIDSGGLTPFTLKGQFIGGIFALWYSLFPSEKNLFRAVAKSFYSKDCSPDPALARLIGLSYLHIKADIDLKGAPPVTKEDLANFTAPIFVAYGEEDIFFDAAKSVERAKQIIPNLVSAQIIAGQGHIMCQKAQARVYNQISDFLGQE